MTTLTSLKMEIERLEMKIERLKMEIEYIEWMLDKEEFDCDTIQYIFQNLKKLDINKTKLDKIENENSSDALSAASDKDLSDEKKKKPITEIIDHSKFSFNFI